MPQFATKLDPVWVRRIAKTPPPWGPLGYFTYKRTYSRLIQREGRTEQFHETLERCVNAVLEYGGRFTVREAEALFMYCYTLQCLPGGRMLWQLGTPTMERLGGDSACNCWYVDTDSYEDFCFAFDRSMLGGGVGFEASGAKLPVVLSGGATHVTDGPSDFSVPDTREGWVDLLRRVYRSYFDTGVPFTYDTRPVRPAGSPILGFGGTASGPGPLTEGVTKLCALLDTCRGRRLSSVDVTDVHTIQGEIVKSGNVRRTALISIGTPDDLPYLRAKRWDLGHVPGYRGLVNMTVECDDTRDLPDDYWYGFENPGEQIGLFNGRLIRSTDPKVRGCNPCVPGDTPITTRQGDVPILSVLNRRVEVWNGEDWAWVTPVLTATGRYQEIMRVTLSDGRHLDCTPAHKWVVPSEDGGEEFKAAGLLGVGDTIVSYPVRPGDAKTWPTVKALEVVDWVRSVFCFNEPLTHRGTFNGIVTGQCAEANLESHEPCDLTETFVPRIKSLNNFVEAQRLLYRVAKTVLQMPFLDARTQEVVRRNQRIGMGITGMRGSGWTHADYRTVYAELRAEDRRYSREIGSAESVKLAVVKPSGTLSLLPGVRPGVHGDVSEHYIRRIRVASGHPLIDAARDHGYFVETALDHNHEPDRRTQIVSFPVTGGVKAGDAIEQLEYHKWVQEAWADQSVSVTVTFKDAEVPAIKAWLAANYRDHVKTVSFMRDYGHGFVQTPYEPISRDLYRHLSYGTRPMLDVTVNRDDYADEVGTECAGGACPVR